MIARGDASADFIQRVMVTENLALCLIATVGLAFALMRQGMHYGPILALLLGALTIYGVVKQRDAMVIPKTVADAFKGSRGFAMMSFITLGMWTPLVIALAFLDFGVGPVSFSVFGALVATLLVFFLIARTSSRAR